MNVGIQFEKYTEIKAEIRIILRVNCSMHLIWVTSLLATVFTGVLAMGPYKTFKGDQVLRVRPHTSDQIKLLVELEDNDVELDFWSQPYNLDHDVDIRVPKNRLPMMQRILHRKGIHYEVLIEDVQRALDEELDSVASASRKKRAVMQSGDFDTLNYYILNSFSSHDEINSWLEKISSQCGKMCSVHEIGLTGEGRQMKVIKISRNRRRNNTRRAIWIDGGIHGREWISPVMATNIIYRLITEYSHSKCVRHIVDNFDWYILPVANPDGYEYSRIRNRMWRKNRRVSAASRKPWWFVYYYGTQSHQKCYGVDLNRNFGFKWGETGTSSNPCSDIYGGPQSFSEPESIAIRNFTHTIHKAGGLAVYLSLHAYGQYWLYSWGYTRQLPSDHRRLSKVAKEGAEAIRLASSRNTQYLVGAAARTLYASSGASDDWAKGGLGAQYAFTVELPPSDANARGNGFLLPVTAIPGVVRDTWPGIKVMAARVLQNSTRRAAHNHHEFCTY